jgi:hypothetical protein
VGGEGEGEVRLALAGLRIERAAGTVSTKWPARRRPKGSSSTAGWSAAKAHTVPRMVSVGSTAALSPVTWAASKSPSSRTSTVRSASSSRSPWRATVTRRMPDLP